MITRQEMMPLLLVTCPSFASAWARHRASVSYDPGLYYRHLAELARHLIDLDQRGQRAEFSGVFAVVECLHLDGDDFVREAATIGLLESLQSNCKRTGVDPERFRGYLEPETARCWEELSRLWPSEPAYADEKRQL